MNRKIFISFLVVALFNLVVGCYTIEKITVPEYMAESDKPDEILVTTKDFKKYSFSHPNFYIENDTLYGMGKTILTNKEQSFEGKFALSDIKYFQVRTSDKNYSVVSVSQYLKIEEEKGKPDEIQFTTIDYNRYQFLKPDYHITEDTLYGKVKLLSGEGEVLLDTKIALSDILFLEVENFDWLKFCLLGGGIYFGIGIILVVAWGVSGGAH